MAEEQVGAIITAGLSDWQILQRDEEGFGDISIQGRWIGDPAGRVEVRVVFEETGAPVLGALNWREADISKEGTWTAKIERIPAGGLYRLETRLNVGSSDEWSTRGDMRHFIGVGDLWVIAGQSNSAGYGRGPFSDPPELGIHLFRNSGAWSLASHPMNESTDTIHAVNQEGANSGHSPYLQFAKTLKRHLNVPIGLIQTSLGGSPLSQWNPTETQNAGLYENMLYCIEIAGGKAKGVVWYQGESDAEGVNAETYEDRFIDAVKAWRKALDPPDLQVVTVQLNRVYGPPNDSLDVGWSRVREAQRRVPKRLPGVAVVPALDLPLSDGIHNSPAGNAQLGDRMARAALGLSGLSVESLAPDLASARRISKDKIELVFENVVQRMDSIDQTAIPFKVEDESGDVPIRSVAYPLDSTLQLVLQRELGRKAVVHGAYGINPPIVPIDAERLVPMLGFYGVPVE